MCVCVYVRNGRRLAGGRFTVHASERDVHFGAHIFSQPLVPCLVKAKKAQARHTPPRQPCVECSRVVVSNPFLMSTKYETAVELYSKNSGSLYIIQVIIILYHHIITDTVYSSLLCTIVSNNTITTSTRYDYRTGTVLSTGILVPLL